MNNPVNLIDPKGLDFLFYQGSDRQLIWVFTNEKGEEISRVTWNANSGGPKGTPISEGDYTLSPADKEFHPGQEDSWGPFSYRLHETLSEGV